MFIAKWVEIYLVVFSPVLCTHKQPDFCKKNILLSSGDPKNIISSKISNYHYTQSNHYYFIYIIIYMRK